jgi:N-acetylglutamate synthase-like GNAT family acetyltransferase
LVSAQIPSPGSGDAPAVREATRADVPGFARFLRAAWEEAGPDAPGFTGATEDVIAELTQPELIRQRIEGKGRRLFIAIEADRIIGFAATRRINTSDIELAGVVVLQSRIGEGIGTRLLRLATAAASEAGYSRMQVRTETTNDAARSFYEASGFTLGGTTIEQVDVTDVAVWELWRPLQDVQKRGGR